MASRIDKLVGHKIADRYCITADLGQGAMGRVFRAISLDDPTQDVAIKIIQSDRRLDSEDLLRFQKEAALMSRLHHPNIVCFHELGLLDEDSHFGDMSSGFYIVMEIVNGLTLTESLRREARKDLPFFFQLGLQLSSALDYTHTKNIIHRDIKPHNIIVGRANKDQRGLLVKVLDFGVAKLDESMHHSEGVAGRADDVAGTPLYMAPEQSSLIEAPIDHRVDLYSVGCVLYETLTGRPPFSGSSRDKLLRQHAHDQPELITALRPDVPKIVGDIIHKLLEKHPDERYQSAFALQSDLLRAKRRLLRRDSAKNLSFPLATNDRFRGVSAKLSLVGREQHLDTMKRSYEELLKGSQRSRMVVISGDSGLGKSRLLSEFRNYLAARKMRFVSANFMQHANSLEFNALANGFNEYLLRIRKSQPHEAEELRRKVKTLLGSSAHQVAAVVPGLKPFLDSELDEQPLDQEEFDFKTFAKAFSDFTRCLAIDQSPVVFIFDDLHWADVNSLKLIDQFFSHNNSQKFLMIIAHRAQEGASAERFGNFLSKFQKLRRRFDQVELDLFSSKEIMAITSNLLGDKNAVTDELVNYLLEKSQGNPMHVVELVRTLVLRDLIYLKPEDHTWKYEVDAIRKTDVQVDSIDLVLTKIQNLQEAESTILQVASSIGVSFPFELLHMSGALDASKIASVLSRAMDAGIIARTQDDPEMVHLGKTYMFTHWRTRESIYQLIPSEQRKALHMAIADRLEQAMTSTTPKIAFALAHHVNQALEHTQTPNSMLVSKVIQHNQQAGEIAWRVGALPAAQRYLELAFSMLDADHTKQTVERRGHQADILEALADIDNEQKRLGQALQKYRRLLDEFDVRPERLPTVTSKVMHVQAVNGMITGPIKEALKLFQKMNLPLPSKSELHLWLGRMSVLRDMVGSDVRKHRLYKALKLAVMRHKQRDSSDGSADGIHEVLLLMQGLFLQEDPAYSLVIHRHLLGEVLAGKTSSKITLRILGERCLILGRKGRIRTSYQILDRVIDACQGLKDANLEGYFHMQRALLLDYPKSRHEDVADHLNKALKCISPERNRLWIGVCLEFQVFQELMRGNLTQVADLGKRMPEVIPTRSWISPRWAVFVSYSLLIKGSRDALVNYIEPYLRRRRVVSARSSDLFVAVLQVILTFAKGEIDKTRKYFVIAMKEFCRSHEKQFLYPFEEDFLMLFGYTFPQLFEQEYGRRLMRDVEMIILWKQLHKRVSLIKRSDRDVANLARGRSLEVLGKKGSSRAYDKVLNSTKASQHHLIGIFSSIWFGQSLLKSGRKKGSDFILRGYRKAHELGLGAVTGYAEKILDGSKASYEKLTSTGDMKKESSQQGRQLSHFIHEHLEHVQMALDLDNALEVNVEESMAILQRAFPQSNVFVLSHTDDSKITCLYPFQNEKDLNQIYEYVTPYVNIRSTLFLPIQDAPWKKVEGHKSSQRDHSVVGNTIASGRENINLAGEPDATLVMDLDAEQATDTSHTRRDGSRSAQYLFDLSMSDLKETEGDGFRKKEALRMNALVPVQCGHGGFGLIVIEDLDLQGKDSARYRQDLDVFGHQLGLLFSNKSEVAALPAEKDVPRQGSHIHKPGGFHLEAVPWLRLAPYGLLRSSRESVWYLGLNLGPDFYLLTYCRLNGPEKVRHKMSGMIWYEMQVLRSVLWAAGRQAIDVNDIRDELGALMRSSKSIHKLDHFSLTFTIFDRRERWAYSGHFGPSRPVVFCQDNRVRPTNEVFIALANGRDIRFWAVVAAMSGLHLYLLSHDTSRLEANPSAQTMRSLRQTLLTSGQIENLFRVVEDLIHKENVPRYYVAAVQSEDAEEESDSGSSDDSQ